jgi:hypothetical protein
MKLDYRQRNIKVLIAGLAIIVVTNVVALVGVAYNRAGEPEAEIELTERELAMPYRYGMGKENTGLGLRIRCRIARENEHYGYGRCSGTPEWFTREKLIELGFKLQLREEAGTAHQVWKKELPRKAYLVLEYDGALYQRAVASAEEELNAQQQLLKNNPNKEEFTKRVNAARDRLKAEQHYHSRLFAIDAGMDETALRRLYDDSSRYLIMQALIKPIWRRSDTEKEGKWEGWITGLLVGTINIPLEHRSVFEPLEDTQHNRNRTEQPPRYEVSLALGKRTEPWVIAVGAL